jgi:hypothetical protein
LQKQFRAIKIGLDKACAPAGRARIASRES